MTHNAVDALLQTLRRDIDASFAVRRQQLESIATRQPYRPRPVEGTQPATSDAQATASTQWDKLTALLASIDSSTSLDASAPLQARTSHTSHQEQSQQQQQQQQQQQTVDELIARRSERSVLRLQLAMLALDDSAMPLATTQPHLCAATSRELLQRCFEAWSARARASSETRAVATAAHTRLLTAKLRKCMQFWRRWSSARAARRKVAHQVIRTIDVALQQRAWRAWTLRHRRALFTKQLQTAATRRAFACWQQHRQHWQAIQTRAAHLSVCARKHRVLNLLQHATRARAAQHARHSVATAWRKQRQCTRVLASWTLATATVQRRRHAITHLLYRRALRWSFGQLCAVAACAKHREAALCAWRMQRSVQRWRRHSRLSSHFATLSSVVAAQTARRRLQTFAWQPWRRCFMLRIHQRTLVARQHKRLVERVWIAFVHATAAKRHGATQRDAATALVVLHMKRRAWRQWTAQCARHAAQQCRYITAAAHARRSLLQRVFQMFTLLQTLQRKQRIADAHVLCRALRAWRLATAMVQQQRSERVQQLTRLVLRGTTRRLQQHARVRHLERCRCVWRVWRHQLHVRDARLVLTHVGCRLRLLHAFQRWRRFLQTRQQLRAAAATVRQRYLQRLRRHFFVVRWWRRTRGIQMARCQLQRLAARVALASSLERWRFTTRWQALKRRASAVAAASCQRRVLQLLAAAVAVTRARVRVARMRHVAAFWTAWQRLVERRHAVRTAAQRWRRLQLHHAVDKLVQYTIAAAQRHAQHDTAAAWYRAGQLERVRNAWTAVVASRRRARRCAHLVAWRTVGLRAWRHWQRAFRLQRVCRYVQRCVAFSLVQRVWRAFVQLTKRRQVAQSMWRYTAAHVRLQRSISAWQQRTATQRQQRQRIGILQHTQQQRWQQRALAAWSQWTVATALAALRMRRADLRAVIACWHRWITHSRGRRLQRLVKRTQQRRALTHWRLELWLRVSTRRLGLRMAVLVLQRWRLFVMQCRTDARALVVLELQRHRRFEAQGEQQVGSEESDRQQQQKCIALKRCVFSAWQLIVKSGRKSRRKQQQLQSCTLQALECRDATRKQQQQRKTRLTCVVGQTAESDKENCAPRQQLAHGRASRPMPKRRNVRASYTCDRRGAAPQARRQCRLTLPPSTTLSADDVELATLEHWARQIVATCFFTWKHLSISDDNH